MTYFSDQSLRKLPKIPDIKAVKLALGSEICTNVLFLHVILGCDTTSHLYGIGKGASLKKFKSSRHFREKAKVFNAESAFVHPDPMQLPHAGEHFTLCFRHVHRKVLQSVWQLHRMIFKSSSGAGGKSVCTGISPPSRFSQPHSSGSRSKPFHYCT